MTSTIQEFADVWADRHPRPSLDTDRHNAAMIRPLVRKFGHRTVCQLSKADAAAFAAEHPSSVRYARSFVNDAVADGLAESNPFAGIRVPRSRGRADIDALTEAEVWQLADLAQHHHGDTFRAFLVICAFTGLRGSEAAALEPSDIDRSQRPLQAAVRHGKGNVARKVVIPPQAEREALSVPYRTVLGKRWNRSSWSRALRPVVADFGRPITLHHLRHFACSWMLDRGASPFDVAQQLHGHQRPDVVLEVYAHADQRKSLSRLAEVCGA